jgi:hypothetical protein
VGDSNASPGRRASLQKEFADEVADALEKLNRRVSEMLPASGESIGTVTVQ